MLVPRLMFLLAILCPVDVGAQTVGDYLKAPAPQQDAMVHLLTSRASAVFTAPPQAGLAEDQLSAYEYKRVFGNFIILMFDTVGVSGEKSPLGFAQVRSTIKGNPLLEESPANPSNDLSSTVGGYLETEFKSMDKKNEITNALPSLAKMTNSVQVAFLKQLYERQYRESVEAFNKQYEENQKQYKKMDEEDKALLKFGSAMGEVVKADEINLQLEELALYNPYPNEETIRAHWKEVYLPTVRRLRAATQQNVKSDAEKKALTATFEDYDYKQVAQLIDERIRVNSSADPYRILYSIFEPMYKQNLQRLRAGSQ